MDTAKALGRDVLDAFGEHDLLTYASAIAFRVLFALVPFALFALALLGALSLGSIWNDHLAPQIGPKVSPPVFALLDSTVGQIVSHQQPFWLTVGLAIALWSMSAAVRTASTALDLIYGGESLRGFREKLWMSLWIGAALGVLVVATIAVLRFEPAVVGAHGLLLGAASTLLRYGLACALLGAGVALLVRRATDSPQPWRLVGLGSALVVGGWLATWALYGLYLTKLASLGSVYGAFATVVVLLTFLQLSAIVMLGGVVIDGLIRERTDEAPGPL